MTEREFLVLTAIAGGRKHGYAILLDVREMSSGEVDPHVPTLYRLLDRLVGEGLVDEAGEEVVGGRFRRYYDLTSAGFERLEQAVALRTVTTSQARSRLRLRPRRGIRLGPAT